MLLLLSVARGRTNAVTSRQQSGCKVKSVQLRQTIAERSAIDLATSLIKRDYSDRQSYQPAAAAAVTMDTGALLVVLH